MVGRRIVYHHARGPLAGLNQIVGVVHDGMIFPDTIGPVVVPNDQRTAKFHRTRHTKTYTLFTEELPHVNRNRSRNRAPVARNLPQSN